METCHILEIFCEWYARFWHKGAVADERKVCIPRAMVFKLEKRRRGGSKGKVRFGGRVGFEGLQILDARLYCDWSLLELILIRSRDEREVLGHRVW